MSMTLIQWGRERERVLERERGKVMGVAIFAGKWTIGPGNVLATPRDLVREARAVRDLVRTGRVQANSGLVREVRDLVRTGRGQAKVGMVREVRDLVRTSRGQAQVGMVWGEMVKVLGTKVHFTPAI